MWVILDIIQFMLCNKCCYYALREWKSLIFIITCQIGVLALIVSDEWVCALCHNLNDIQHSSITLILHVVITDSNVIEQ